MTVYVDNMRAPYRRMIMCHMIADNPGQLKEMANHIGVQLKWFQSSASMPHFDICLSKREAALRAGAVEADRRLFVEIAKRARCTWPRLNGKWLLP